jgi:hypothetical protein
MGSVDRGRSPVHFPPKSRGNNAYEFEVDCRCFILTAVVVLWQWRQRLRIATVAA